MRPSLCAHTFCSDMQICTMDVGGDWRPFFHCTCSHTMIHQILDTCGHGSRTLYWCPDPGRWLVHKLVNVEMWDKSLNWRYSSHQHWWPPPTWNSGHFTGWGFPLRASLRWNCRCIRTSLQHEHLNTYKCKSLCSCTVFKEHESSLYAVRLKWLFCWS